MEGWMEVNPTGLDWSSSIFRPIKTTAHTHTHQHTHSHTHAHTHTTSPTHTDTHCAESAVELIRAGGFWGSQVRVPPPHPGSPRQLRG